MGVFPSLARSASLPLLRTFTLPTSFTIALWPSLTTLLPTRSACDDDHGRGGGGVLFWTCERSRLRRWSTTVWAARLRSMTLRLVLDADCRSRCVSVNMTFSSERSARALSSRAWRERSSSERRRVCAARDERADEIRGFPH